MTKRYNSGRVQKLPQSGITTDRYEFLGLEQAEPDLGDPIVGVSSVQARPFNGNIYEWYILASDNSGAGKRYWLPKDIVIAENVRQAGAITIRSNDNLIGIPNGVYDLNFKGGITITAPGTVAGIGNSGVDIEITNVPEAERSEQAGNLEGGNPGSLPYQEATNSTVFLPGPGLERQVLSYNPTTIAPTWRNILDLKPIEVEQKLQDQNYYLSYLVSTGSTSTIGIGQSVLSFNPSKIRLGIGTDNPSSTLDVRGDVIISGISTFESNSTFKKSIIVQENFNVTGLSTFNNRVSIGATLSVTGVSTFSNNVSIGATLNVTGVSTFSNNVSISKTDGLLNVKSPAIFTGITTVNTLTAQSLSPDGIDYGTNLYVPVANAVGSWTWQPVFDAGAGSIDGITIFENGAQVGTDIIALDFLNQNYSITLSGSVANIAFSETPNFTSITAGFSSEVTLNSTGVKVSGIVTSTKLDVGSLNADSSGIRVSGFVTTTNLKVTNNATIDNNLTVTGDLTVNGQTTTINSVTLTVDDKLISLASTATPSDIGADGGGIELKGNTDHTILWSNANDSWDFSENLNIITGKVYRINNASVLSATSLGAGVTNSSLTSLGTITTGIWQGSQIDDNYIGTINDSNKVSLSALDIDGAAETTSVVDADLLIIDDGANGTNRKVTASNLKTYVGSNLSLSGSLSGNLNLNGNDIIGTSGNINISGNIKAGIITATTFNGSLSGTATTATDLSRSVNTPVTGGLTGGGQLNQDLSLSLKNAASLSNNTILKWNSTNGELTNASITDTGSLVTVSSTIKLAGIQDSSNSAGSANNVPIANGSGGWSWGTVASSGALTDIVNDTTPQLGGNLDLNSKNINGTGNININGNITAGIITATTFNGSLSGTGNININGNITAGIITATTFSGSFSGTATGIDKSVIAGNGLTGGGALTSDVTLNVGAGTGITVNADDIALKNSSSLTSNRALKWDGTQLSNTNITDNGTQVSIASSIKIEYGIIDKNNSAGNNTYIPVADGTGSWQWSQLSSAGGISGISVREESNSAFTGITELKFTGINVTATSSGSVATITIPDTVAFATTSTNLSRSVNTPSDGGLTGGGQLNADLNLKLKNSASLSNNTILKWNSTNGELTNASITDTGSLVTVSSTIKLAGIQDSGNSTGSANNIPIANGSGGWSWGALSSAGGITGITVSEEGSAISATSFKTINFVSGNLTASDAGSFQANITLTDNPNFVNINATGIVTTTTLRSTNINATGIVTTTTLISTNINATGIITAGTYDVSSDINLKDSVEIIKDPLDKIVKIDGVTFNWKENNKPSMGVIAQNIEEVLPELVSSGETKHVNYNGLIGLLIESIKELKYEIEELKKNINN
jgi:hypothetical protein